MSTDMAIGLFPSRTMGFYSGTRLNQSPKSELEPLHLVFCAYWVLRLFDELSLRMERQTNLRSMPDTARAVFRKAAPFRTSGQ